VRIGASIAPTPRCIELFEQVSRLLEQLETAASGRTFDPTSVSDEITISCNYYQRILVLPALYDLLRTKAPKLVIHVMRASNQGKNSCAGAKRISLCLQPVCPEPACSSERS